jgi:phosphate transport system permease protein
MPTASSNLVMTARTNLWRTINERAGRAFLFTIASVAALAVLFIFAYITRNALPFFQSRGFTEFLTSSSWYPSREPPQFGALAMFAGSSIVTVGSILFALPLGIAAAICLSDVLPFSVRQVVKPVVEVLAAIPSVAYGFFALVVFAPLLQQSGGKVLGIAWLCLAVPVLILASAVLGDLSSSRFKHTRYKGIVQGLWTTLFGAIAVWLLWRSAGFIYHLEIQTGTNALNASLILGIMALPTIVSVAEDALQASGRSLREGSYALGATRAETMCKVVIPASSSGILAGVLLGVMRALGETMVVWMASGNAAQVPEPIYNFLKPIRTLTATIAGDMGEADHVTGSDRYHVLFAMGLALLAFCFICNLASDWVMERQRKRLRGE